MEKIAVYVRMDEDGRILAINSSAFLKDIDGWVKIDEGLGDRYAHAQGNYMPKELYTKGVPRYWWDGEQALERTAEEIASDVAAIKSQIEARTTETAKAAQEALKAQVQQAISDMGIGAVAEDIAKIKTALAKFGIRL